MTKTILGLAFELRSKMPRRAVRAGSAEAVETRSRLHTIGVAIRTLGRQSKLPGRVRLLLLVLSILVGLGLIAQVLITGRTVVDRVVGAALVIVLLGGWAWAFRLGRFPILLDILLAATFPPLAFILGDGFAVLGLFFPGVWFRSQYGSARSAGFATVLSIGALLAALAVTAPVTLGIVAALELEVLLTAVVSFSIKSALEDGDRLEEKVRRSERHFRSLIQNSSDVILTVRADGQITYQTPSTERVLGYASPSLVGRSLATMVHPDDRAAVEALLTASVEGPATLEWRLLHADDTWMHVEATASGGASDSDLGGLVLTIRNVTDRKVFERRLTHQAVHDALTDLPNRTLVHERLVAELAAATVRGGCVGVFFVDLDDFKAVNDTLGHAVGDQLLVAVAGRLAAGLRGSDLAGRLGGDEFAVVAPLRTAAEAEIIASRLSACFEVPFEIDGHSLAVRASTGVATSGPADTATSMLQHADVAMYAAKGHGKARYETYDGSMGEAVLRRVSIGNDLADALTQEQFFLEYQPIIDLATGNTVAAEALVRWRHPARGVVPPLEFIPIVEQTGLILPLGRWILRTACAQGRAWEAGYRRGDSSPLVVTVNVSARELISADFVAHVEAILRETGFAPGSLVLEMTESIFVNEPALVGERLEALRGLGVRIALDDFGTGYSSLAYLHEFPVDFIKIDRSFVRDMGIDPKKAAVVRSIAALATSLEIRSVAEGIETAAQHSAVRAYGYQYAQGYRFARPLSPIAFVSRLANTRGRPPTWMTPVRLLPDLQLV